MRQPFRVTFIAAVLGLSLTPYAPPARAQADAIPTKVLVRVLARDAKVIGSKVGGARVTIRDVKTGAILAQGIQQGGTGDTRLIMLKPRERGAKVFNVPGTAAFEATLMLEAPKVVEVIAEGPLGSPQSLQRASKTLLLVPGVDVVGEGLLLEIHGYIINLISPQEDAHVRLGHELEIRATLNMA